MDNEIIKDITDYIDFLRSVGYSVSISDFDRVFNKHLKVLFEYEVHQPLLCSYLKSNNSTLGRCSKNKNKLMRKHPKKPFYSCCYAGVEEYVIPIVFESKTIVCVNISGYRGEMKESEFLSKKIGKICDERFFELYNKLSTNPPNMKKALKITKPLKYMFIEFYKKCSLESTDEKSTDTLYRMAMNYVYENYMNEINCAVIAKKINYSESYLRHTFLKLSGVSLSTFINSVRLDKAKELLKYTNLSVTQIAESTGFCDSNYFSTVFKKSFNITPIKYRKMYK